MLFEIIMTLTVLLNCFTMWSSRCTTIVGRQRRAILELRSELEDKFEMFQILDRVDFMQHYWYLVTLRNPYKLYKFTRQ